MATRRRKKRLKRRIRKATYKGRVKKTSRLLKRKQKISDKEKKKELGIKTKAGAALQKASDKFRTASGRTAKSLQASVANSSPKPKGALNQSPVPTGSLSDPKKDKKRSKEFLKTQQKAVNEQKKKSRKKKDAGVPTSTATQQTQDPFGPQQEIFVQNETGVTADGFTQGPGVTIPSQTTNQIGQTSAQGASIGFDVPSGRQSLDGANTAAPFQGDLSKRNQSSEGGNDSLSNEAFESARSDIDPVFANLKDDLTSLSQLELDPEKFKREALKNAQAEIRAQRAVFDDERKKVVTEGQGRLGTQRAISARGGLLGSDFGEAQKAGVQDFNQQQRGALNNQENLAISKVFAQARSDADQRFNTMANLKLQGGDRLVQAIEMERGFLDEGLQDSVRAMIAQGIDPNNLSSENINELAATYKSTPARVISLHAQLTPEADQEFFNLSAGQARYAYNPQTGKVEQIASRAKAGTSGGAGGGIAGGPTGGAVNPVIQGYVNQIASGGASLRNVPLGQRDAVTLELDRQGVISLSAVQRGTVEAIGNARNLVNEVVEKGYGIDFADSPIDRVSQGFKNVMGAWTQSNTEATVFKDFKEGIVSMLSRALGERGVLTDQDVDRARKLLPRLADTQETVDGKADQLLNLFDEFEQRALQTAGGRFLETSPGQVTETRFGQPQVQAGGQTFQPQFNSGNDPLGIL